MRDVFLVDAIGTPIGRGTADGALHGIHPADLLAATLNAVTVRAGVEPSHVRDVNAGCVPAVGEQGTNIARLAAPQARLTVRNTATIVERWNP
ncbi:MAG: hypothetical protein IT165_23010 [Bryobacterales bacterium]|nr:hypothetical protein [Bryobacterales bacterium]